MSLIKALAEDERGGEEDDEGEAPEGRQRPPIDEEVGEEEDEEPSSAEPSRAPSPSPSHSRAQTSHLTESSTTTTSTDSSTGEPPSFLSPLPQSSGNRPRAGTGTNLEASVIDAIHRPMERKEEGGDDAGEENSEQEQENEGEGAGSALEKTVVRRKRLASKLEEIFGFQEAEEVIAGQLFLFHSLSATQELTHLGRTEFPCWLFRSILLQGFLFLTTDHLAFYAYLPPRGEVRPFTSTPPPVR